MIRSFLFLLSILIISSAQAKYYPGSDTLISTGKASLEIRNVDKLLRTYRSAYAYHGKLYTNNEMLYHNIPFGCMVTSLACYPPHVEYVGEYIKYKTSTGHYAYDITVGDGDMSPELITISCFGYKKELDFTFHEAGDSFSDIGYIGTSSY